jgi:hypothetical protein
VAAGEGGHETSHVGLVRLGRDIVDQRADQRVVGRRRGRARQRAHPLGDARAHHVESGQHVTPEPHRVVVSPVEGQPGDRLGHAPDPLRQQDRLSVARRGGHQHQPAVQALLEPVCQPATRHQPWPRTRHLKLGSQQNVPLGRRSFHTTASTISSAVDALSRCARRRPRCHFSRRSMPECMVSSSRVSWVTPVRAGVRKRGPGRGRTPCSAARAGRPGPPPGRR